MTASFRAVVPAKVGTHIPETGGYGSPPSRGRHQVWLAAFQLAAIAIAIPPAPAQHPRPPYPAFYPDPAPFLASLRAVEEVRPQRVTGITVPHHMLAADVIAHGFRAAAGG